MRVVALAALITAALAALAVSGVATAAAERPLAELVPPDVSTYSELNLDRILGRAPETAALGEAYARLKSPQLIRSMFTELADDPQALAQVEEVLGMLKTASNAIGPRLGWATWIPDAQAITSGMMGGGSPTQMMPKLLMVADLKDPAAFDALVGAVAAKAKLPTRVSTGESGLRITTFAEGMVELIRSDDWMALGFPPEQARKAADLAGRKTAASLYSDPGYQSVLGRLPADAFMTEYVAASSVKQLLAVVNMLVPSADFSYPSDEPLGMAMGARVEQIGDRKMATAYYTADLDTLPYLIDAPLTLQAVMLRPVIERSRASARKAMCLSNMKNLAVAGQTYAADHDDRLPDADRWVEELRPYLNNEAVFKCPEDKSQAFASYAMNAALSGMSLDDIEDPSAVVLFYETASPGPNPVGGMEDLASPRHLDGNNFAFPDGHAQWVGPDREPPSFGP